MSHPHAGLVAAILVAEPVDETALLEAMPAKMSAVVAAANRRCPYLIVGVARPTR
jgi:hypothetical protein